MSAIFLISLKNLNFAVLCRAVLREYGKGLHSYQNFMNKMELGRFPLTNPCEFGSHGDSHLKNPIKTKQRTTVLQTRTQNTVAART